MKLFMRGGIAALAIAGAALVATGCGGSDSGSSAAAKDAAALDFVPKDAIGYITVDTDIEGDAWSKFEKVYPAFNAKFDGLDSWTTDLAEGADKDVDFKKDVEPWLGDSAGAALLAVGKEGGDPDVFAWIELSDSAKFGDFAKDQGLKKSSDKVGDFEVWTDPKDDETVVGVSDELAVVAMGKKQLTSIVEFDGDSIKDADGVGDAIDEVEGDSLATLVVSGAGVRTAIKDSGSTLASAGDVEQIKDLDALAVSFGATDDGLQVDGFVGTSGDGTLKNAKNTTFEALPGDTVLALGGSDLGGGIAGIADSAGKDNAQIQQGVGVISGVLGVTVDDLEKAFDGSFALSLSSSDEGLGALVGGIAGAALGGGSVGGDQLGGLLKSGAVTLAFEETGSTSETLEKIVTGAGALTGGKVTAKAATAGDFTTNTVGIQGIPVTVAKSDDVAGLSVGLDVFSDWGAESLGDNDAFKDAWDAAGAPDETAGAMWLDWARVSTLAGLKGAEGTEAGGWVGWIDADGGDASFGVFMHVPKT